MPPGSQRGIFRVERTLRAYVLARISRISSRTHADDGNLDATNTTKTIALRAQNKFPATSPRYSKEINSPGTYGRDDARSWRILGLEQTETNASLKRSQSSIHPGTRHGAMSGLFGGRGSLPFSRFSPRSPSIQNTARA